MTPTGAWSANNLTSLFGAIVSQVLTMRVIHLLRKYDVTEWGGTETAVQRLFEGLHRHGVTSLMYCPRVNGISAAEPRSENGSAIKRFNSSTTLV